MTLPVETLERMLLVQANELAAQRRTIERQAARIRSLEVVVERDVPTPAPMTKELRDPIRRAYRKGYRSGWSAGRRGRDLDHEPERRARTEIRQALA